MAVYVKHFVDVFFIGFCEYDKYEHILYYNN